MNRVAPILVLLMLSSTIGGCLWWEEEEEIVIEGGPFSFDQDRPITTWYHYAGSVSAPWAVDATDQGAVSAANITANLSGNSTPYFANATYYGTGFDTFEPTIGITGSGAIFFTNWNGLGDGTHIIRSRDQGQTWEDVGPFGMSDDQGQTPNSNDP